MKTNEHHPADKHQVTTALELIDHINGFGNLFITMGGVGGIGKTAFAVSTVDALQHNKLEPQIVDADEENSANKAGCLKKFFPGAHKIDIKTRQGLDAMATISLANKITVGDLGASSGAATFRWFSDHGENLREMGLRVTLAAVVTPSAKSVESLLNWASHLKGSVNYLLVFNWRDVGIDSVDPDDSERAKVFPYLYQTDGGKAFLAKVEPVKIDFKDRNPEISMELEARGLSHRRALISSPEQLGEFLSSPLRRSRIKSEFDHFNREFTKATNLLFP
jgi:hypothetical protein